MVRDVKLIVVKSKKGYAVEINNGYGRTFLLSDFVESLDELEQNIICIKNAISGSKVEIPE